jgi:hypothetical protein
MQNMNVMVGETDLVRSPPPDVVKIAACLRDLANGFEDGSRYESEHLVMMLRQWAELLVTAY